MIYLVTVISWVIFTVSGALGQCVLVKIKDGQALKLLKITSVGKNYIFEH